MRQQSFAASATFTFVLVAAGAIGMGAVPAHARQNAQVDVQANAVRGVAGDPTAKKICRRIAVTGSRMAKDRVCLSAEDWKKVEDVK